LWSISLAILRGLGTKGLAVRAGCRYKVAAFAAISGWVKNDRDLVTVLQRIGFPSAAKHQ
jgi:hypothetical protein